MDPINYTSGLAQAQNPLQAFMGGLQTGTQVMGLQQQQQARDLALQRQQAMQSDMAALSRNPTPEAIAAASVKYPELGEHLKRSYDMLAPEAQRAQLDHMAQVYGAVQSGRTDLAEQLLTQRADAMEKAGANPAQIQATRTMAQWVQQHPETFKTSSGLILASALGPEKFASTFATLGDQARAAELQPLKARQEAATADIKDAEAVTKGIEATNAPTATALGNQVQREKIETARSEREIARLDTAIKQANSETERDRLQLERDKLQAELDLKKQAQSEGAQTQLEGLQQGVETVDGLLKHPGLWSGTGRGGDFAAWFNGSDAADFRAQLATLKSQQFLAAAQNLKGMGALSDAEGARLEKAIASLDTAQSSKQLTTQLNVIRAELNRAQSKLAASGKLPTAGGAFVMKHTLYGNVSEGQVNRLMAQKPGTTREQVLQFLRSTGGQ